MPLSNSILNIHQLKSNPLKDAFARPMCDLRISVIDRCNFRCTYCMPQEKYGKHYNFLPKEDWLTFGEIVRVTKLLATLGISKVRITGGEPLLRPKLDQLIKQISSIDGIEDLALTTNGYFLQNHAQKLRHAGLSRLTVSLDTLDEKIFGQINGQRSSVQHILTGISIAKSAGFKKIKINAVIQKDINDTSLLNLVDYAREKKHILRFIEYMDVGNCNHWKSAAVIKNKDILAQIANHYPLTAVEPNYYGEVAERYLFDDGEGEIGFISSVSQPFCATCTRLRLSTDGKLYTCLFAAQGTDLRAPLRNGASDAELIKLITNTWQKRNDKYSENRYLFQSLKTKLPKMEMYQIGG